MAIATLGFLKKLLDTPGPSGFELAPARVWRDEVKSFADDVRADVHGNSVAALNPKGKPRLMFAGHIDEIGIQITHIDDDGYLYFAGIGGWDSQVLVGQRVVLLTREGPVHGVVGKKAIHQLKKEDLERVTKVIDLWIDIEPDVALVVDVTHATDYPGADKKHAGDHKLGGGVVLSRGSSVSPVVFDLLVECAEQAKIAYTVQAAPRDTGTDADAIYNAMRGIPTGLVSVPNRYMHSPNEMVAVQDLDRAADLLAAFARRLEPNTDFIPR